MTVSSHTSDYNALLVSMQKSCTAWLIAGRFIYVYYQAVIIELPAFNTYGGCICGKHAIIDM
jgi:hypothetical protein